MKALARFHMKPINSWTHMQSGKDNEIVCRAKKRNSTLLFEEKDTENERAV